MDGALFIVAEQLQGTGHFIVQLIQSFFLGFPWKPAIP